MRIKRLLVLGTFILLVVCMGLYLLVDRTLSQDRRKVPMKENVALKSVMDFSLVPQDSSSQVRLSATPRLTHGNLKTPQCSAPLSRPNVDIQMGEVYDSLKFDNSDGGVWKQGWPITYNEGDFTENRKLRVFVVPHSHNDPGWTKTFEEYYMRQTRDILNHMVEKLQVDKRWKFIWAEISFFALWWTEASQASKDRVKEFLENGQLEIVTGGWVMTDEANSHFYSIVGQLTEGHQWLLENLNYRPRISWSIDPFGLSPSLPMILSKSGFDALAVQRTHYSVKKYLAKNKQLEFRWRQTWDGSGYTDILTHMMPFYSYDVPHTCGPDPKICCQFDFKRLVGYGLSCPWRVPPKPITKINVAAKSDLLVDQYKKKAQLYGTNVLLVPLGDDFRYDHSTEWDAQFGNYQLLFNHINNNSKYHVHASFGTLSDYFSTLEESKPSENFPVLSGDFFTYADRDDHYWSGYYTSRPYYKRMDRVLMSALRSAEVLFTLAVRRNKNVEAWPNLLSNLSIARASHSLFQHHDGITGTAKDHVVIDYANKMLKAIKICQRVIQQAARFLISGDTGLAQNGDEEFFIVLDDERLTTQPQFNPISFGSGKREKLFVFVNTLTFARREVVNLRVDNFFVKVKDGQGRLIPHQVAAICPNFEQGTALCYQLSFEIEIGPLGFLTYSVEPSDADNEPLASVLIFDSKWDYKYPDWPVKKVETSPRKFSLENDHLTAIFNHNGFLEAITLKMEDNLITVPINVAFFRYGTRSRGDKSGAYLFLPDGPSQRVTGRDSEVEPRVTVLEGKLKSQVFVYFEHFVHVTTIHTGKGIEGRGIQIQNFVDISKVNHNYELSMKITTEIKNENVFFTDLNSLQMIRRKTLEKLPLQANFYPMTGAVYIQDLSTRLSVISSQPLGVASLHSGEIEIMQDRRLMQDDNRGVEQGVLDNKPTVALFRLFVEPRVPNCETDDSPWGALSGLVHSSLETLVSPIKPLMWNKDLPPARLPQLVNYGASLPLHISLVGARTLNDMSTGIILRSASLSKCFSPEFFSSGGSINLTSAVSLKRGDAIFESTLTFNQIGAAVEESDKIVLCDNTLSSFYVTHRLTK